MAKRHAIQNYTAGHTKKAWAHATALAQRAKNALHKADKVVETGLRSVVVGGTAFGFGVLQGAKGPVEVMGIPIELIASLAAHGAGFAGVGGGLAPQLHAVGDGALAAYAVTMGRGIGAGMSAKASGLFGADEDVNQT